MKNSKQKFENNWRHKSLENLEKNNWGAIPENESYLVTTCHRLRKKQLKDFSVEDLRIMIGQGIGLKYLIPLALEVLEENILAEGNLYEGDLLETILLSDRNYWIDEIENWDTMREIFSNNLDMLQKEAIEHKTGKEILEAFKNFEKIN